MSLPKPAFNALIETIKNDSDYSPLADRIIDADYFKQSYCDLVIKTTFEEMKSYMNCRLSDYNDADYLATLLNRDNKPFINHATLKADITRILFADAPVDLRLKFTLGQDDNCVQFKHLVKIHHKLWKYLSIKRTRTEHCGVYEQILVKMPKDEYNKLISDSYQFVNILCCKLYDGLLGRSLLECKELVEAFPIFSLSGGEFIDKSYWNWDHIRIEDYRITPEKVATSRIILECE